MRPVLRLAAQVPFLLLGLDLPATPLFQDNMERNAIPQVQLAVIMHKFDGSTIHDNVKTGRRRFSVLRLPPYLILHMKVRPSRHPRPLTLSACFAG